jgi:hypothetical protein
MPTNEQDISRALGRLEGKVDSLLRQFADVGETLQRHDGRLSLLENWRSTVKGSVIVMASLASVIASILTGLILKGLPHG